MCVTVAKTVQKFIRNFVGTRKLTQEMIKPFHALQYAVIIYYYRTYRHQQMFKTCQVKYDNGVLPCSLVTRTFSSNVSAEINLRVCSFK